MLHTNDKIELVNTEYGLSSRHDPSGPAVCHAYFGLGHAIRLLEQPGVFTVSPAGMALGAFLLKTLDEEDLAGRILELGTGSGVLSFLLRSLGARHVTATDVIEQAVALARKNELLNFSDARIRFEVSDVFAQFKAEADVYDTIVFNPPGWRTPSQALLDDLAQAQSGGEMDPSSMFYGDKTLLRFLTDLPAFLHPRGRAIIGMNSLIGIRDVLDKYRELHSGRSPLTFRLVERHTLPLLYYSPAWECVRNRLVKEFDTWQEAGEAVYTADNSGQLYWFYEIIVCRPTAALNSRVFSCH